jgi:transcription initiation factor TFIID subunit 7
MSGSALNAMDEEQFILRLPPELAGRMRLALASKAKRDAAGPPSKFSIQFNDQRNATFTLDGQKYPASLMDLPCIVDSHKFTKKRTFYKSGDVGQVLLVRMPDEPAPTSHKLPDGITPAAKRAAERISPPAEEVSADLVGAVENTIKCIVDNKVAFVRKKADPEKDANLGKDDGTGEQNMNAGAGHEEEIEEIVIEHGDGPTVAGTLESQAQENKRARSGDDAKDARIDGTGSDDAAGAAAPEADTETGQQEAQEYPPTSEPAPSPPPLAVEGAAPQPSPPPDLADDDDDDDEFSNMLAESMLQSSEEAAAKARIARADALRKIEEKRTQISDQAAQAERALNAVLKQRHLRRKAELEAELVQLEAGLAAIV